MSAIGRRTGRVLTSQVELTFLDWVESRLGLCQELGRKLHRRRPPIVAVTVTVKIVHELKARRWRLFFVSNSSRPSVAFLNWTSTMKPIHQSLNLYDRGRRIQLFLTDCVSQVHRWRRSLHVHSNRVSGCPFADNSTSHGRDLSGPYVTATY